MSPHTAPRPIRLGEVQAFLLGMILWTGPDPRDPDDVARYALLHAALPGVDDPEDLLSVGPWTLVLPEDATGLWDLHAVIVGGINVLDDEIEHRLGRGAHADGRAHLREERAAGQRLCAHIIQRLKALEAAQTRR